MSIVILYLKDEKDNATLASLKHGEYEFTALVDGKKASLAGLLGQDCCTEMCYEHLISWQLLAGFEDTDSCIKASARPSGGITIRGRVHSVTVVDAQGTQIFDLYIQNGPEFLAVSSQELEGQLPEVGAGLEVTVEGLCFYPTNI